MTLFQHRTFGAYFSTLFIAAMLYVISATMLSTSARAQANDINPNDNFYSNAEILNAGQRFFGSVSGGLASVLERSFAKYGLPNGYILGEEGSAAIVAGLRYGEGTLYTKNMGEHKVFWQGPSIGWDFGGDGNRTMMLVYHLPDTSAIYRRYIGFNGSAYLVGGFGLTVLGNNGILVVPVRSGVGARLGVNVGYLKFSQRPTWNPF